MQQTVLSAEMSDFLLEHPIRAIFLFRQNMVDQKQLSKFASDLREVMREHEIQVSRYFSLYV
jgi:hypothetical protein